MTFWENLHNIGASAGLIFNPNKYRCEQVISTTLNEIPVSTVQLKTDYFVEKIMDSQNNMAFYFRIDDHISNMFPPQYSQAMDMVNELELIKCNVAVSVDPQTGNIGRVLDMSDVKSKWDKYKTELTTRYKFLRGHDAKKGLEDLVTAMNEMLSNADLYLSELRSKLFFLTFFDKYLVEKDQWEFSSKMHFRSQLFNGIEFNIDTMQEIANESKELVSLSRKGKMPESMRHSKEIEKLYNKNYMPSIQYKFSEYQVEYESSLEINTDTNLLSKAHVYLSEEVSNNIMFSVSCDIRKID